MKTITVRGVDSLLSEKLKQFAKREGKSVNQFIIDTIKQRIGLKKEERFTIEHHDLGRLFGKWSEKEYQQIQGKSIQYLNNTQLI